MPKPQKQQQAPERKAAILARRALVASVRNAPNGVTEKQMPAVREEATAAATETIAKKKSARKSS